MVKVMKQNLRKDVACFHILRGTALLLMAAFLFTSAGCVERDASDKWPRLIIADKTLDFGTANEGDLVALSFDIRNEGEGALRIISVEAKTLGLLAYPLEERLLKGESTRIKVRFDTTGRWEKNRHRITLTTNDPENLVTKLTIEGDILSDYKVSPRVLRVSRSTAEKEKFKSAIFTNLTDKPMTILKVESDNERVRAFLTPPFKTPYTVQPGQTVSIDARLIPNIARTQGMDMAVLTIKDRKRPIRIPVRLNRRR